MKYIILTIFFVQIANFNLPAAPPTGKIEKAFESLNTYNYFEARNLFQKSIRKYPSLAGFGLSLIYFRTDNPFHQVDSAYSRINSAISDYDNAGDAELKKFEEFNLDRDSLIKTRIAIIQLAYHRSIATNDTTAMNNFIKRYQLHFDVSSAARIRDSIAFELSRKANTSVSFHQYMELYPGSHLASEARARYEKSMYDESVFDGKISSYAKFIEQHPASPFGNAAMKKVYELFTANSLDPDVYHQFILKYPHYPQIEDAWQRIYDLHLTSYDEKSILQFKNKYPDYPNQEQLNEDLRLSSITLVAVKEKDKYGLWATDGKMVMEPSYDFIGKFHDGIAVVSQDGKMGYIDKSGEEIIPPFYDDAEDFHDNLAIVGEKEKYGVINRTGKMVVPLSYLEIADFSEGLAAATESDLYGYINRTGTVVIPFKYESASGFNNEMAICQKDELFGVIDKNDLTLIPFEYESLQWLWKDIFKYTRGESAGLIRSDGTLLLPGEFDGIGTFEEGKIVIVKDGKMGYADTSGAIIIQLLFDAGKETLVQSQFHNGMAVVRKNNRYGLIDSTGKIVIQPTFEDLKFLSDSIIAFRKNSKWGAGMRTPNNVLFLPKYDQIFSCEDDNCVVALKGKQGLIDTTGKNILPFQYELLQRIGNGFFMARKLGKYGVLNSDNHEVIPFRYDKYLERDKGVIEFANSSDVIWLDIVNKKVFSKN